MEALTEASILLAQICSTLLQLAKARLQKDVERLSAQAWFRLGDGHLRQWQNWPGSPKIDFGQEPKHPLEDVIRATAGVMSDRVVKAKPETAAKA